MLSRRLNFDRTMTRDFGDASPPEPASILQTRANSIQIYSVFDSQPDESVVGAKRGQRARISLLCVCDPPEIDP